MLQMKLIHLEINIQMKMIKKKLKFLDELNNYVMSIQKKYENS